MLGIQYTNASICRLSQGRNKDTHFFKLMYINLNNVIEYKLYWTRSQYNYNSCFHFWCLGNVSISQRSCYCLHEFNTTVIQNTVNVYVNHWVVLLIRIFWIIRLLIKIFKIHVRIVYINYKMIFSRCSFVMDDCL